MSTRRAFLGTLAGSLLASPLVAGAQAIPRIGLLGDRPWDPLRQGLRDLGYTEVRLKVQVIVTSGTPAALAAKRATTTIPIVMAVTGDPLSTGLVASLARPGGNVTGLTQLGAGLAAKRLELLKELIPSLSRLAFLWNPANPDQKSHFNEAQAGAQLLGVALQSVEVRSAEQLDRVFDAMLRERPRSTSTRF